MKIETTAIVLLLTFVILTVVSCTPTQKQGVFPKEGTTHEVPAFTWKVVSQKEMEQIYTALEGPIPAGGKLSGFVVTDKITGAQTVYTTPIRKVDDDATLVFGHEVLHIILGDYHPKYPGS